MMLKSPPFFSHGRQPFEYDPSYCSTAIATYSAGGETGRGWADFSGEGCW